MPAQGRDLRVALSLIRALAGATDADAAELLGDGREADTGRREAADGKAGTAANYKKRSVSQAWEPR
jgi:hypothetical protein